MQNKTWHSVTRHSRAWCSVANQSKHSKEEQRYHSEASEIIAKRSKASVLKHGTAWQNEAKHSSPQHITTQHTTMLVGDKLHNLDHHGWPNHFFCQKEVRYKTKLEDRVNHVTHVLDSPEQNSHRRVPVSCHQIVPYKSRGFRWQTERERDR